MYVSTVEGIDYPFFATQWHPEKPPYEFSDKTIPHTRTAIDAASLTASLLIDVARLNGHSIDYPEQVKLVIDNYERHFVAAEGPLDEDDPLPDTLWFIPKPKNARTDPEDYPYHTYSTSNNNNNFISRENMMSDRYDDGEVGVVVVGFKGEGDVELRASTVV